MSGSNQRANSMERHRHGRGEPTRLTEQGAIIATPHQRD
jgi:hypothetical protein